MTLVANSVRGGGTLSGYNCFTVDEGRTDAEYICGTVSGTSVTGLERAVSPSNGTTTVSAIAHAHRVGADVKITDFPLIQRLRNLLNAVEQFPSLLSYVAGTDCTGLSASNSICGKSYIDSVAVAGASNANETTKGISELATQIEQASSMSLGSTGASLVLQAKYATSSPGTANIWTVITQNNGKINPLFLNGTTDNYSFNGTTTLATSTTASSTITTLNVGTINAIGTSTGLYPQVFGDGSDSASTTAASYTLTRDYYFTNYTVSAGNTINTGGYRIFVNGTLINNGTLTNAGGNASSNTAGTAGATGSLSGGGAGAGGSTGASTSGGGGGGGGVVWIAAKTIATEGTITVAGGNGGNASNPGGGANNSNGTAGGSITKTLIQTGTGGAGGASSGGAGGAGGTISASTMSTRNIGIMNAFYDFLTSLPLAGGAGGGSGGATSASSNAGGGGGGQGGVIFELYHTLITSGTRTVIGGNAGTGLGTGGLNGVAGSSGIAIPIAI